ncbi:shikimate kinase [Bradyrhizobium sp. WSM1417]|uniref:shikimate kinase n=1 Tax=Bradyrhizobium sp. WSM1417 TaxID=754500 RepID=UPI0012EC45CF
MPWLATFLQKVATHFEREFVPRLEDAVHSEKSWCYATTCNAVSREAGGQAGILACKAMAEQVSRLAHQLMRKVEPGALSLFALSFGRHPGSTKCRDATTKVAKLYCGENRVREEPNGQDLSLLVNSFSKWPKEPSCRKAAAAIASEMLSRKRSDFKPQELATLVNGFCKWPSEPGCRMAAVAIADSVRPHRLSEFNKQHLVNLVNGFSKWPDEPGCRKATVAIAGEVRPGQLSHFEPRALANLVNGFSKWPDEPGCRRATVAIAGEVRPGQLSHFEPLHLTNLVNGFSKWPDEPGCRKATIAIAGEVHGGQLSHFERQTLAVLVNGFSKWPDEPSCCEATVAIAGEVRGRQVSHFERQTLAVLVNGFSKWPDEPDCRKATVAIASAVHSRKLSDFEPRHLVNLVNGFSKWPKEPSCCKATVAIAGAVLSRKPADFELQHLANLVNGLSKWRDEPDCRKAIVAIAGQVHRGNLSAFNQQALANLVNGFSKWPKELSCREATVVIADGVLSRKLSDFKPQELVNLVNGFSKWPVEPGCRKAAVAIAGKVRPHQLSDFESQDLANLVNGFSKWPDEPGCRKAILAIADEVRPGQLSDFEPHALANLVNGFSKWPVEPGCRKATVVVAGEVRGGKLSHFDSQALAVLVNGFSKWPVEPDCRSATVAIAGEVRGGELSCFDPQTLANLVNGFSKWPVEPDCRKATVAIAGEVRGGELSYFDPQALAVLVNGFSKWPVEPHCREATVAIAGAMLSRKLSDFEPQHLTNLVNGVSKWPNEPDCREATVAVAHAVLSRKLSDFKPQELVNLVNGFSKWPDEPDCRKAAVAIASTVLSRKLSDFDPQALANLVNGFSKWPDEPNCRKATAAVAGGMRPGQLSHFDPKALAVLVNGFSKWPIEPHCRKATVAIVGAVLSRKLSDFEPQHLTNLVNGCSKWPGEPDCRKATVAIAGIMRRGQLSDFGPQALSNLVNGFCKWPDEPECRTATVAIASVMHRGQLSDFGPQALANLVNGFSKWPDEPECRTATVAIAGIMRRGQLSHFDPQALANLVNGFGKLPAEPDCSNGTGAIAGEVLSRKLSDFEPHHLVNLVNGFSKWSDEPDCRDAAVAIAGEVSPGQLSHFDPQAMAVLANGFSKWPNEAACHQAIIRLARDLGTRGRRFGDFTTPQLSMIAHALGRSCMRGEDTGEITETALLSDRLHRVAHHLEYAADRLEQADVLIIATIFKALSKARLFDDLGLLAPIGLARLEELLHGSGFMAENNLESMGNLCVALLPLACNSQKSTRRHRRQALYLLNDLQPVLEQKVAAHLTASDTERTRGSLSTRRPALSIYQVLKAREVLASFYRRPHVEGSKPDLAIRRQELESGSKKMLANARDLIQGDLSDKSWNLIAQIEEDETIDALDTFMTHDAARIRAQHPASVFDVHQVLQAMDHEPRPPQGEVGLLQLPVVDMQGRRVATEPETRYSIFHRLTSGVLPVVAVQLPAKPSAFMLARTLAVEGVPYRMDLFGGSKLKAPRPTLSQIAATVPGEPDPITPGGKLLAIPYSETAPGTAFEQLSRAWAPFKEAYYYTQRRGFAAPPAVSDLSPHDYALEGAFRLLLLPDRPANEQHPFRLTGPDGPIALRPHDGCGFIKASLAERMGVIRLVAQGADRVHAFAEGRRSSLPASALQHYPRSEQVAQEAREKAKSWLESREGETLTADQLFRTVTAGHIDGPGAVAVPSGDGDLHVPTLKSDTLTGTNGVLVGRSPYDKANLRPFAAEHVKLSFDGDPTAAFLDKCVAMQYSFNVAQKSRKQLTPEDPTFFSKGILIVVPEEMWPSNYADRGLVMSAEDVKSHSNWTQRKDRVTVDTRVDCVGILQATELFAPGSLVAVPIGEQKKLDGDFDGDTVIIIGDRPQLYAHVRAFDQKEQARRVRSLKPPKSHTPAMEGGSYQFSRGRQILAATQDVLETYSTLQRHFLAQSHQAQRWFAERAIFGIYEGVHHELRRDIRDLLNQEQVSSQDIQAKLERARDEIAAADHPVAREAAVRLVADLKAWAAREDEQVLPKAVESGSDPNSTVSETLSELFPDLAEAYQVAPHPRDRVQSLLDHYPARIDPRPDGYIPDDCVQSANNLLSLGIKVGTDAYKSDTGAPLFMKKSRELQRLLQQTPGLNSAPFGKSLAATLSQGRFDVDATLEDLKDNPTLAASIMEASIGLAVEKHILPKSSGRQPVAENSTVTVKLTREEASKRAQMEAARAKAEEEAITTTAFLVARALRKANLQVNMPHLDHRLKSESSIRKQLTGKSVVSDAAQLISNAVRHVFEIPDKDFRLAFMKAMLAFEEQGYAEISTANWFRMHDPAFVGIKSVLATPGSYRFEVEFHTPASYQAKVVNHDTYKELEKLRQQASGDAQEQREAEELAQRAREVCKEVAIPDGAQSISHWQVEESRRWGASAAFGLRAVERPRTLERSPIAQEIVTALGTRPIVLVGLPASGKSTIGAYLATRLRLPFIDSDKQIEKVTDMSISDTFATKGEPWFRDCEAKVIAQSLEKGPAVLATGGGSFMCEETRHLISEKAVSIWLDTDQNKIRKRLSKDKSRPLLQTSDRNKAFNEMVEKRTPHYRHADLTFVPREKRDNKNADVCVQALRTYLCGNGAPDASK